MNPECGANPPTDSLGFVVMYNVVMPSVLEDPDTGVWTAIDDHVQQHVDEGQPDVERPSRLLE